MVRSDTEDGDARASQLTHECPRRLPDDPLREASCAGSCADCTDTQGYGNRPLVSPTRRRADAESGHIRPFPVTRGLTPSNRVGSPHAEEAAVSGYAALCQPSAEPDHLVSHLILKSDIRKASLTWSPVTESNRRPSPYHVDSGSRFNCCDAGQARFRCRPGAGQCLRFSPCSGTRLARTDLFRVRVSAFGSDGSSTAVTWSYVRRARFSCLAVSSLTPVALSVLGPL